MSEKTGDTQMEEAARDFRKGIAESLQGKRIWIALGLISLALFALIEYERPGWATALLAVVFILLYWTNRFNIVNYARTKPLRLLGLIALYLVLGVGWSMGKWYFFVLGQHDEYKEARREFLKDKQLALNGEIPQELRQEWFTYFTARHNKAMSVATLNHRVMICSTDEPRTVTVSALRRDFVETFDSLAISFSDREAFVRGDQPIAPVFEARWKDFLAQAVKKDADDFAACVRRVTDEISPDPREHQTRILVWMTYWPWSASWTVLNDPVRRTFRWTYERLQDVYDDISDHIYRDLKQDLPSAPASQWQKERPAWAV